MALQLTRLGRELRWLATTWFDDELVPMLRSQAVLYDSSHDVRTIESAVVADLLQTLLSGKRMAWQAAAQSSGAYRRG